MSPLLKDMMKSRFNKYTATPQSHNIRIRIGVIETELVVSPNTDVHECQFADGFMFVRGGVQVLEYVASEQFHKLFFLDRSHQCVYIYANWNCVNNCFKYTVVIDGKTIVFQSESFNDVVAIFN